MLKSNESLRQEAFDLSTCLKNVGHWLPSQGPIQDFIHHNTLHAFQGFSFHDGVRAAARLYGATSYMSFSFYQRAYREGRIRSSALSRVLAEKTQDTKERDFIFQRMMSVFGNKPLRMPGVREKGLYSRWSKKFGLDLNAQVHPLLFKLVSNYLDQGIAIWEMPGPDDSFYACIQNLCAKSLFPLGALSDALIRVVLQKSPDEAISYCLQRLVGQVDHFESYLLQMHLAHPGWSGMVFELEQNPTLHRVSRKITLKEMTAIELLLQLGYTVRKLGVQFEPMARPGDTLAPMPHEIAPEPTAEENLLELWHNAFEWSYYEDLLEGMLSVSPVAETTKPKVQALFCLDDRESSTRRYLESEFPVETFGTAGFFGLDFFFQGASDLVPYKHCPLPVQPKHLVREKKRAAVADGALAQNDNFHFDHNTNTFLRGWIITQTLGFWAALKLAFNIFRPSFSRAAASALNRIDDFGELILKREHDTHKDGEYFAGYSLMEMADRVQGLIQSVGMSKHIADLVVLYAHGSSSVNNPYFAAYDCGACSGKPGSPNARAFALMANDKAVREILRTRGLAIPESTWFLGAIHDTARDEIRYFDLQALPQTHTHLFAQFEAAMNRALEKNAKERCRRFHLVPKKISLKNALKEVRRRSVAIFEPRPEYNHATNAACFVGRRSLVKSLFMDRRVFLNSYDPQADADGKILEQILGAVVPVCGGINLEYFFSRVDPTVYGADSKLPHNVLGLVGVMNGVEGDLLTGLPTQMTEVHDPIRLLLTIDQEPEITLRALQARPAVWEWIANEWMKVVCISPKSRKTYLCKKSGFEELELDLRKPIPIAVSELQLIQGKEGNIPVHRLALDKKQAGDV